MSGKIMNFLLRHRVSFIMGLFVGADLSRIWAEDYSPYILLYSIWDAVLCTLFFRFRKNGVWTLCLFIGIVLTYIAGFLVNLFEVFEPEAVAGVALRWVSMFALVGFCAFIVLFKNKEHSSPRRSHWLTFVVGAVAGIYFGAGIEDSITLAVLGAASVILCVLFAKLRSLPLFVAFCIVVLLDISVRISGWRVPYVPLENMFAALVWTSVIIFCVVFALRTRRGKSPRQDPSEIHTEMRVAPRT